MTFSQLMFTTTKNVMIRLPIFTNVNDTIANNGIVNFRFRIQIKIIIWKNPHLLNKLLKDLLSIYEEYGLGTAPSDNTRALCRRIGEKVWFKNFIHACFNYIYLFM